VDVLPSPVIAPKFPEHVRDKLGDIFWFLPHGDESMAIEALLRFKTFVHHISKSRLPGASHPDDGDNLEPGLAASVHDNLGHLLHRPVQADEVAWVDVEHGQAWVDGWGRGADGRRVVVALTLLAQLDDALLEVLELAGDDVAVGHRRELLRAATKPSEEPGAGGGRGAVAVDADAEEVNPVLYVVGDLADAADPGAGLSVGVVEGLAVVDGGAHGGELILEEDDVSADAGEECVLLLQQLAELPRKLVHHARQSADDNVHLAES
jgi:hypothetical protein